jgi:hypothetical protein
MTLTYDIKTEMLNAARKYVPALLGMSVLLGLFSGAHSSLSEILAHVVPSLLIGVTMCAFGLFAFFIGLWTTNQTQNQMYGWLSGLALGLAGIALMFWFYANPTN